MLAKDFFEYIFFCGMNGHLVDNAVSLYHTVKIHSKEMKKIDHAKDIRKLY